MKEIENIEFGIPIHIKKMCHNCLKWKTLDNYKKQDLSFYKEYNDIVENNTCIDCQKNNGFLNDFMPKFYFNEDLEAEANSKLWGNSTPLDRSHECAFIGNVPYKKICKTFKIKYIKK